MSIFDFTPAGALVTAIEIAHEKDRENTRRAAATATATATAATSAMHVRAATKVRRIWTMVLGAARMAQPAATPR